MSNANIEAQINLRMRMRKSDQALQCSTVYLMILLTGIECPVHAQADLNLHCPPMRCSSVFSRVRSYTQFLDKNSGHTNEML